MKNKGVMKQERNEPRGWVIDVATATEIPLVAKWLKTVEGDLAQFCFSSCAVPDTFYFKITTNFIIMDKTKK